MNIEIDGNSVSYDFKKFQKMQLIYKNSHSYNFVPYCWTQRFPEVLSLCVFPTIILNTPTPNTALQFSQHLFTKFQYLSKFFLMWSYPIKFSENKKKNEEGSFKITEEF